MQPDQEKYLIDQNLSYEEFIEYNKLYCDVMNSLINPGKRQILFFDLQNTKK